MKQNQTVEQQLYDAECIYVTKYADRTITVTVDPPFSVPGLCLGAPDPEFEKALPPIPEVSEPGPLFGLSQSQVSLIRQLEGDGRVIRLPDSPEQFSYQRLRAEALASLRETQKLNDQLCV